MSVFFCFPVALILKCSSRLPSLHAQAVGMWEGLNPVFFYFNTSPLVRLLGMLAQVT